MRERVKSRAVRTAPVSLPRRASRARRSLGLLGLVCVGVLARFGAVQPASAQVLLGGRLSPAEPRPEIPLDPHLPSGAEERTPPRPLDLPEPPACSLRYPLCVHRTAESVDGARALAWLTSLESAYERVVFVLGAAGPLPDGARGGNDALDVYLTADGDPDADVRVEEDARDVGRATDSASAFCVAGSGGFVERSATLCLGEAVALRSNAAGSPFTRRAIATELWLATGTPTSADARALDDAQAHPERALLARDLSGAAEGSALLFELLDRAKGRGAPEDLALATLALSARTASPPGFRFVNEPDVADVLRATFGGTPTDTARLFSELSVARAFVGSRDASGALPGLAWLGDFGRVRFEWSVDSRSLPRQLAPARPVEPTGATYLWVSLGPDVGARELVFQASWEAPVAFRWALLLLDASGRLLRQLDVPFLERETHVDRIVSGLEGAAGLLVVGTNLGGLGPTYPFDPDFEPFEPHAYAVALSLRDRSAPP